MGAVAAGPESGGCGMLVRWGGVPGRAGAGAVLSGRDGKTEVGIGFVVLVLLGAV